jgi:glyoxylase-like metal-dependent hydrolase (beta-lactamase superfamily II)
VNVLTHGLFWIDLHFLGRPHAIATGVVRGAGGVALVDPGPTSCLETLERGLQQHGIHMADVQHLLLTHLHLDHAGSAGTIVRAHPRIRVYVHERGARHLADPAKLLDSATRLYGDQMDRLWGEFAAVPRENLVELTGDEQIEAGGRTFAVAYTPGHASHHVSYFDSSSGVAFVGDTAGICIDGGYVVPPTPPPDIDLDLWAASVTRIEAWSPSTLFLTHFGPSATVRPHLQALLEHLQLTADMVRTSLNESGTDEERSARFAEALRRELRRHMTDTQLASYTFAAPFEHLWLGLARYWRKRGSEGRGGDR